MQFRPSGLPSDCGCTLMTSLSDKFFLCFHESIVIPDSNLKDIIIRTAVDQRKVQNLKLNNIFKHIDKNNLSTRSTINILKNINIKRTLWGND